MAKIPNLKAIRDWVLSKTLTLTNNLLATQAGVSAMDAAQGPVIQGQFDEINSNINGNILTYNESEDAYYIQHGADAVPKKLGSGGISSATLLGSSAGQYTFTDDYTLVVISSFAVKTYVKGTSIVVPESGHENYYESMYSVGESSATLTHVLKNVKKGLQVVITPASGDGTPSTAGRTEIIGIK